MKIINCLIVSLALMLVGCSSSDVYTYNDSNPKYSTEDDIYYPGTLTEFVSIYQEVRAKGCKRYTNDPTYVYTCESESLVITNTGRAGRYITFCAYWANKEYCSQGSQTRW